MYEYYNYLVLQKIIKKIEKDVILNGYKFEGWALARGK